MIEIKSWVHGGVLYTAENATDVKTALKEAVLSGAVLSGADLSGAVLRDADLSGADLSGAVLRDAVLSDADLSGADLRDAVLSGADLSGADLRDAVLRDAVLSGADLSGADLRDADLSGADLRGAVLRDADLSGADLSGADLSGADHRNHPLWAFRIDLFDVLDRAPAEVAGLRAALVEGRVNGSTYQGTCACLVGTIANVRGVDVETIDLPKEASRPAERWFLPIREGDRALAVPARATESEGVFRASWALLWLEEWVASRLSIAEALAA